MMAIRDMIPRITRNHARPERARPWCQSRGRGAASSYPKLRNFALGVRITVIENLINSD
jgi:hypothetical protein